MSLALNEDFNLLPESCRLGGMMLGWFCHMVPPIGEDTPEGVIGGVEVGGIKTDEEPRASGLIGDMSKEEAPTENDLGDGTAEPVEAYNGRSSSGL